MMLLGISLILAGFSDSAPARAVGLVGVTLAISGLVVYVVGRVRHWWAWK